LVPSTKLNYTSTISSVDAIAKYKWSIDADSVANTANLNYDYRTPGNHFIKLDIWTINGCTYSITKNIVIDSIVTNFALNPVRFCGSGIASFTNLTTNFGAIDLYDWRFGDGNTSTSKDPTNNYLLPGNYTVRLIASTINGCSDTTAFIDTIRVFNLPTATISGLSTVCLVSSTKLNYTSTITSVDAIAKYKWSIDADSVANTANLNYDYRTPGNHIIKLDVWTINGCTFSVTKNIVIDSIVTNFSVLPNRFCGSGIASFTNLTTNFAAIDFYDWRFGDGNTSTSQDPTNNYLLPGNYTVRLIASTINGCSDTTAFVDTIRVFNLPTATISGLATVCLVPSTKLNYTSTITSVDAIAKYKC
jgi:PKD repeat protein